MDTDACETYRRNIDESIFEEPVEGVASSRWPQAELVIGGPPCQGFSQLGRRDPLDPRNTLWTHYARVLRACGAKVFIMENVPQLLASDQFALFEETVSNRGFKVKFDVLMRQTTVCLRRGDVQSLFGSNSVSQASPSKPTVRTAARGFPTLMFAWLLRGYRRFQRATNGADHGPIYGQRPS